MGERMLKAVFIIAVLFLLQAGEVLAQNTINSDLTQLSLQDLMNVPVYSASKREEPFFNTPAATYVITSEDIRRSGAMSIPELLRMVPGLSVQQINSHSWDVSARGFNGSILNNKLLVLIDGRAVYTPLYGGVFWEFQDTLFEDIDRIEVIRGPGGTLWGANAVNGVINIITKKAKETQGGYMEAGGGTHDKVFTGLRYGAKSGDWFYRTYVKYFDKGEGYRTSGTARDEWDEERGGFKAENQNWTVQGDYYQANIGERTLVSSFSPPYNVINDKSPIGTGGNLLTRYNQEDWFLQTYWQITDLKVPTIEELRNMFDMEFNRHTSLTVNQTLTWGMEYRLNLEDYRNSSTITINAPPEADQLFSTFIQDEIKMGDKLKFIIGTKLEHNVYTHIEVEPNARISYDFNERNMVWAAASRAIRTPSRLETSGQTLSALAAPTAFTSIVGNSELSSEKMRSYEIGYRTRPNDYLYFDVASFADHYDHLVTLIQGAPFIENGFPVVPFNYVNGLTGEIYGVEVAADLQLRQWWKLKAAYTYSKSNITPDPGVHDIIVEHLLENSVAPHIFFLRSSFDLPYGYSLDATLRYMDSFQNGNIPSNTEMDINIGKTIKNWRWSIVGENLFRDHHKESYAGISSATTQVPRSVYMKVSRKF